MNLAMVPKILRSGSSARQPSAAPKRAAGAGPIAGHMMAALVGVLAGYITFVELDPSGALNPPDRLLSYLATMGRGFAFFFAFNGWMAFLVMFALLIPVSYAIYRLTKGSRLRTLVSVLYGMSAGYGVALLAYRIAGGNPLNTDACRELECMHASAILYLPAGALAGLVFARVAYGNWWGLNEPSTGVRS